SLAGACAVLDVQTRQDMLLFDIGGGSTEFIRAEAGQARDAISRPLGVVRLVETHLASDPPSDRDYAAMVNAARAHLEAVSRFWEQHGAAHPPAHLVGTAGTVTTLAATEMNLVPYDADAVNNHVMTRQSIADLRERLCAMTHEARESLPTIEEGRADLIIAGLAIVEAVMDCWNYPAMTVVDAGLLEGVWLQARSDQALRK
ncbi:MAG: Ppx/GppA family phosphatase, partial [Deltaproteobacteria bacterium]